MLHFVSCIVLAIMVATLILLIWYPWPYRIISGGDSLLLLVLAVDVVMGPLITLAIFDVRKPRRELRRDLAIIVVLQLGALFYGLHTVYLARPAVLALEGFRFRVTTANDVAAEELPLAPPGLNRLALNGPRLVGVRVTSADTFDAVSSALEGVDVGSRPKYWRHWDDASRQEALKQAKPVSEALRQKRGDRVAIEEAVARTSRSVEELLYLPLLARRTDWSVLIDKTTGDPVGFAPIDGF